MAATDKMMIRYVNAALTIKYYIIITGTFHKVCFHIFCDSYAFAFKVDCGKDSGKLIHMTSVCLSLPLSASFSLYSDDL